jgi:hypothetical protein
MKNKEFKIKLVSLLEGDKKEINHELAVHFCHTCIRAAQICYDSKSGTLRLLLLFTNRSGLL